MWKGREHPEKSHAAKYNLLQIVSLRYVFLTMVDLTEMRNYQSSHLYQPPEVGYYCLSVSAHVCFMAIRFEGKIINLERYKIKTKMSSFLFHSMPA